MRLIINDVLTGFTSWRRRRRTASKWSTTVIAVNVPAENSHHWEEGMVSTMTDKLFWHSVELSKDYFVVTFSQLNTTEPMLFEILDTSFGTASQTLMSSLYCLKGILWLDLSFLHCTKTHSAAPCLHGMHTYLRELQLFGCNRTIFNAIINNRILIRTDFQVIFAVGNVDKKRFMVQGRH